jgi:hypothetical protein
MNAITADMTMNEKLKCRAESKRIRRQKETDFRAYKALNGLLKVMLSILLFITIVTVSWITIESLQVLERSTSVASGIPQTVVVEEGDTLWNIAKAHAPNDMNFTDYMNKIKRANAMQGSGLVSGQTLLLP